MASAALSAVVGAREIPGVPGWFAAWSEAQGLFCGTDYAALLAWRAHVLGDRPDEAPEARRAIAPAPLRHLHCPACWTDLPVGKDLDFLACPACGHGMSWADVEDPWQCTVCGDVSDGPPASDVHADARAPGRRRARCGGRFERRPYLPFAVAWRGSEVVALVADAERPEVRDVLGADGWTWRAAPGSWAGIRAGDARLHGFFASRNTLKNS